MTHTCKVCGETDIAKFRVDKRRGKPRTDCRKCENKARRERQKRRNNPDNYESLGELENKLSTKIHTDEATGVITATVNTVGVPADPKEFMISRGLNPDDYEIIDSSIGCSSVTMKLRGEDGVETPTQVFNFNLKVKFVPVALKAFAFEPIKPLRIEIKEYKPKLRKQKNKKLRKALIFPDSQNGFYRDLTTSELIPFHDRRCWDLSFQAVEYWQPDDVFYLGDMWDLAAMGKYTNPPEVKYTSELSGHELAFCIGKHKQIKPDINQEFVPGNHEKRMRELLLNNFSEAYGIRQYVHDKNRPDPIYPIISVPHILGLEEIGVKWHKDYPNGLVNLGTNCELFHGTKAKSHGGDTAKAYLTNTRKSCIYGHIHRNELVWYTFYVHGVPQYRFAASPGTFALVGGKTPAVKDENNWQNGMLRVIYDPEGDFINVEPISIINGKMFMDGEMFEGNFDMEELCDVTGHDYLVGQRRILA